MTPVWRRNYPNGNMMTCSIRLPEELEKILRKIAKSRGHSFSEFCREALDQWAKAHEGKG